MSKQRTLIRGGTVITMEPGAIDGLADILLEGDQIAAIGPDLAVAQGSARIVDATDRIVIPGFIDTHRHVYQALLRGLGSNWSLMQYLIAIIGTIGPRFTPADLFIANRLGALDAIDSGVTAVFDWSQNQLTPDHTDALIAGLESTSIRAAFGSGANLADLLECLAPPFLSTASTNAKEVRRLRNQYPSDTGLLTIGFAARGPELSTMDAVKEDWALARELGIRLNMHLGQAVFPGRPAVAALNDAGLLGSDLTFGHCNYLTDDEIAMMADHGVTATVTPEDECNMGHGWPPIGRLIAGGVWPNIGIDTCLAVGGDQFTAMRFALAIPRAQRNQDALASGENPWEVVLTTRDALRMATIEGARALGQENRIGSIAVGKQADLVTINTAHPSMTPVIDPVASVVHSASRTVVSDVFIAGRHVKKNGQLVGADVARLHAEATQAAAELLQRCGIGPGWLPSMPPS
ncbi:MULTISPECIES: amidohydrolase family protein [unclassified Mycobacterium]|uniref:amidohydrolase family protein n=1 Tax=unclassified Mycobacterium TaxID=2642494 RepID=UPI0029C96069|nr:MULTISPECIES: amidohydrolase family protein [unclassified Mycobacterium]